MKRKPIESPFIEGDIVQVGYDASSKATFVQYCVGFRSHAIVRNPDGTLKRVAAKHMFLLERKS